MGFDVVAPGLLFGDGSLVLVELVGERADLGQVAGYALFDLCKLAATVGDALPYASPSLFERFSLGFEARQSVLPGRCQAHQVHHSHALFLDVACNGQAFFGDRRDRIELFFKLRRLGHQLFLDGGDLSL